MGKVISNVTAGLCSVLSSKNLSKTQVIFHRFITIREETFGEPRAGTTGIHHSVNKAPCTGNDCRLSHYLSFQFMAGWRIPSGETGTLIRISDVCSTTKAMHGM